MNTKTRMLLASALATISLDVAVTWGGEVVKAPAQRKPTTTHADEEALRRAEEKRQRKAAKRLPTIS